jgi:hypothetical protein
MVKKVVYLSDYISASDAANILTAKHGRPISTDYVRLLSKRKTQPVRFVRIGNRLAYNKHDVETCVIRKRESEY